MIERPPSLNIFLSFEINVGHLSRTGDVFGMFAPSCFMMVAKAEAIALSLGVAFSGSRLCAKDKQKRLAKMDATLTQQQTSSDPYESKTTKDQD